MAGKQPKTTFLERASYRQRRMRDVAWVLPVVGLLLFLVPLLWPKGSPAHGTSDAMLFLFGVWFLLILCAAALARYLQFDPSGEDEGR